MEVADQGVLATITKSPYLSGGTHTGIARINSSVHDAWRVFADFDFERIIFIWLGPYRFTELLWKDKVETGRVATPTI